MIKLKIICFLSLALLTVISVASQTKICSAADGLVELPGQIESAGTYFEIKDSEYLNLTLESSEKVNVILESIPRIVSIDINNTDDSINSTVLTLGGLELNKTYYKYVDSYKNRTVFISNENGTYSWNQDLNQRHNIWIQEMKSTIFLSENDHSVCGKWDEGTKTCTLFWDLYETVEIIEDGITLDCAGHKITGPGGSSFYSGIHINGKNSVTVKNCTVTNFSYGIWFRGSSYGKLTNNNVFGNYRGISLSFSNANILTDNIAISNEQVGIELVCSFNNFFIENTMSGNCYNFSLQGGEDVHFENYIDTSNLVDGKPIYYLLNIEDQIFDSSTNAGSFYCINCNNITVKDLTLSKNGNGIFFRNTHNSKIDNIVASGNEKGIDLFYSTNNTIRNSNFLDNYFGIQLNMSDNNIMIDNNILGSRHGIPFSGSSNNTIANSDFSNNIIGIAFANHSDGNTIIENNISNNSERGIHFQYSDNNTITENMLFENKYGLTLYSAVANKIYHNNFIDNYYQVTLWEQWEKSFFDNGYPDGGNYWDDYDESLEGCKDADNNGICDDPYVFEYGIGQDNYPFINENGWEGQKTVPLYTQIESPYPHRTEEEEWANKDYAKGLNYSCGSTIANCGCALTSSVMILRYYDVVNVNDLDVNPRTLNEWLRNNEGYFGASIDWLKVAEYSEYEVKYASKRSGNYEDNFALLDEYLNKNQPTIARERILSTKTGEYFDHFIVLDKKLADTYGVKDPTWYNTKKLNETTTDWVGKIRNYNNKFYGLRLFYPWDGTATSALSVTLASPAEILVTDSLGRKLGKDPIAGIEYNTIPNGSYFTENIGDVSEELPPSDHENKALYIENPEDGEYKVEIIGTGSGSYEMGILVYDQNRNSEHMIYKGETTVNNIQEFEFGYSEETVQQIQLHQIIDINIKPGSEPSSINLESKGVTPVAVLSNQFFDAQEINIESILFSGANPVKWNTKDVDDDGDLDLILHFETQDLNLTSLDIEAILTGELNNGTLIKGSNPIRIVGKNNKK